MTLRSGAFKAPASAYSATRPFRGAAGDPFVSGPTELEAAVEFEPAKYGGFANRCLDPLGYAALFDPMPDADRIARPADDLQILAACAKNGKHFH